MKLRLPAVFLCAVCGLLVRTSLAEPLPPLLPSNGNSSVAGTSSAPRRTVQFALRIEQFTPAEPAAAAAGEGTPTVLGTPKLSTLDRDTATAAVSSPAFGYSIAVSPVVETAPLGAAAQAQTIQTSWNVRLTGKSLPAGTTIVTLTGATRLTTGKDAVLAEITLRDEAGKPTAFRVRVTATLPDTPPPAP